jgi:Uma2 family endonuclease
LPFLPRQSLKKNHSTEDLKAIAAQYPSDFVWTHEKIKEVFPFSYKAKMELIAGVLSIYPNVIATEPEIVGNIGFMMLQVIEKKRRGELLFAPFDLVLDKENIFQPAICFIPFSRRRTVKDNLVTGLPDLVLEIVSSTESVQEREKKRDLYERFGVKEYWEVRPDKRRIEVEILQDGEFIPYSKARRAGEVRSKVLKGFSLLLEDIFEGS